MALSGILDNVKSQQKKTSPSIYIVGAGGVGQKIFLLLRKINRQVIAFLDDDPNNIAKNIENIPINGPIHAVLDNMHARFSDELIIAVPNISREQLRNIYYAAKRAEFRRIRFLPPHIALQDPISLVQVRDIQSKDIIPLHQISINNVVNNSFFKDKRILITGAGGTVGTECAKQLLYSGVSNLFLLENNELALYTIDSELCMWQEDGIGKSIAIKPILGDIKNADHMYWLLENIKPDVIFHTAAYKHAPMLEDHPIAAIENNVFGTKNLLEAANATGVQRFVFMSTDKGVDPTNVYGASKLLAERLVISNEQPGAAYLAVRCGNILASSGSVVPYFHRKIDNDTPLTVTSSNARRFFMSIPETTALLLNVIADGLHGKVYILNMNDELPIRMIAEEIIRYHGYDIDDWPIRYTKLRAGEKEAEHIKHAHETETDSGIHNVKILTASQNEKTDIGKQIKELEPFCNKNLAQGRLYRNEDKLRAVLRSMNILS